MTVVQPLIRCDCPGDNLADLLTRLTTLEGHLPQGAPTSGALANLILSPLDLILEDIGARLGLVVTRYVDNIDFSGVRTREAILPTIAALQQAGFSVGRKKVFNAGYRAPHIVTGQLVDGRIARLPRRKRANVRANVDEIICRHEAGLSNSTKAMNVLCPVSFIATLCGTPARTRFRTADRRMS